MGSSPITIFSSRLEKVNLFFPIVLLVILAWELLSGHVYTNDQKKIALFSAKILFLNHVHIYFSFALILFVPEMRNWVREKNVENQFFLLRWLFVFLAVFGLYWWGFRFIRQNSSDLTLLKFLLLLTTIVGLHHNYSQTLGLSLAYNHAAKTPALAPEKALILRLVFLEKVLLKLLMALHFTLMLAALLRPSSSTLFAIIKVAMPLLAIAAVVIGWMYPQEYRNKKLFMLRYVFFAFIPVSFTALIAVLAIHGVEYLCVFRKMVTTSVQKNHLSQKLMTIGTIGFVAVLTTVGIFGRSSRGLWYKPLLPYDSELGLFLLAVATAAAFLHYHVDAYMFRMSDPITRASTGALLFPNPEGISHQARQPTNRSLVESKWWNLVAPWKSKTSISK